VTRKVGGNDRAQLDDRVVAFLLHAAGANDDTMLVQRQVRLVEEEHLADLSVQRNQPEGCHGRALIVLWHGQLELDAVGVLYQREQLSELLVRRFWSFSRC